jgi:hypothetical protein
MTRVRVAKSTRRNCNFAIESLCPPQKRAIPANYNAKYPATRVGVRTKLLDGRKSIYGRASERSGEWNQWIGSGLCSSSYLIPVSDLFRWETPCRSIMAKLLIAPSHRRNFVVVQVSLAHAKQTVILAAAKRGALNFRSSKLTTTTTTITTQCHQQQSLPNTSSSPAERDTLALTPYFPKHPLTQVVELIQADYNVVILDNLVNSSTEAIRRIEGIVGKEVAFENVDLCDFEAVKRVFGKYEVDSVIHFAGLKVFPLRRKEGLMVRLLGKVERSLWSIIV